jgi:D-threo-aldose 1-dehydrogenase
MKIPFSKVGRTGLEVTRLGLGAAFLPLIKGPEAVEDAVKTICTAWDNGINFIDMAPMYGHGESERRVGAALAGMNHPGLVLETKVRRPIKAWGEDHPELSDYYVVDYSRDSILRGLEGSLQRLGVSCIDILLLHDPDPFYQDAVDQAFPVLQDLRSQGLVKAIGAGMNRWAMLAEFARHADPDCFLLAGRYTLLEQGALEFLDLCRQRQISVFLGGVFNSGILATGAKPGALYNYSEAPPEIMEKVRRIELVCAAHNVPLKAAAVQFAAAHPGVSSLILGMASPEEVVENLQVWQLPIPHGLWDDLRSQGLIDSQAPIPG